MCKSLLDFLVLSIYDGNLIKAITNNIWVHLSVSLLFRWLSVVTHCDLFSPFWTFEPSLIHHERLMFCFSNWNKDTLQWFLHGLTKWEKHQDSFSYLRQFFLNRWSAPFPPSLSPSHPFPFALLLNTVMPFSAYPCRRALPLATTRSSAANITI